MSRRLPLSRASKVCEYLVAQNPSVAWDRLPVSLTSDSDVAYEVMADALAQRGLLLEYLAGSQTQTEVISADERTVGPQDVTMLARWAASPQVFDVDPELEKALARTGSVDVPAVALRHLPYPIQYFRCDAGGYDGFLAWIDRDPERVDGDILSLAYLSRGSMVRHKFCVPLDGTVGDFIRSTVLQDASLQQSLAAEGVTMTYDDLLAYRDLDDKPGKYAQLEELISTSLAIVLYVCSQEADLEVAYRPPAGGRGQRAGRKTNPETITSVGARVGRALGEARRASVSSCAIGSGGRTVSPHVRSGHWQRFWVGPRKGRDDGRFGDDVIVRWVPPVAVMGGHGSEVVHGVKAPR